MENGVKKDYKSFDFFLVLAVFVLTIMGIVVIGSATQVTTGGNQYYFYIQIIWMLLGTVGMIVAAFIDYNFLGKFYGLAYVVNLTLLLLVFIVGTAIKGANRWMGIGDFGVQPSEFSKIIMIFCMAKMIDKKKEKMNNIFVVLFLIMLGLLPVVLIFLQKALSTTIVLTVIIAVTLFVGEVKWRYVLITLSIVAVGGYLFVTDVQREEPRFAKIILQQYQYNRIYAMLHPELTKDTLYYQTKNSIDAIGAGQLTGMGIYNGRSNNSKKVPDSRNDFIMSVIGEEFGFAGCMVFLGIMFIIVIKCILIGCRAPDMFGRIICLGVAAMFAFQTFVNVSVATGIVPNTGMNFPFVSYGGSSLLSNMAAIGLVLNVGMTKTKSFFEGG